MGAIVSAVGSAASRPIRRVRRRDGDIEIPDAIGYESRNDGAARAEPRRTTLA
jgi:hypothetical protein